MAEGLRLIVIGLLSAASLTGLFLALAALFPAVVRRSVEAMDDAPGRAVALGLANGLFLAVVGLGLTSLSQGSGLDLLQIPAIAFLSLFLITLCFGLAAVVQLVGERLFPGAGPVRQRIWASLVLALGTLTPFVGWFGLLPYVAALGIGGFLLGWLRRPALAEE